MHRSLRPALLAGALATAVLATAGSAASKPSALQVPDPAGDAVAPGAGYDITA